MAGLALPDNFDSEQNWPQCAKIIGDVRDQSNCGCCWAFAGSEAASDRMCIATNATLLLPISAQDVCFNSNFDGCDGGQIDTPWSYIKQSGAASTRDLAHSVLDCAALSLCHIAITMDRKA